MLKVKFSVWESEHNHMAEERELTAYDITGLVDRFRDACDLIELRRKVAVLEHERKSQPPPPQRLPREMEKPCGECGSPDHCEESGWVCPPKKPPKQERVKCPTCNRLSKFKDYCSECANLMPLPKKQEPRGRE